MPPTSHHDRRRRPPLTPPSFRLGRRYRAPGHDVTDVIVAFVEGLGTRDLVHTEPIAAERTADLRDAQLPAPGADPGRHIDRVNPEANG